ncbi:MAG: diguanylate cyclase [Roseibium sp.]|nr:diguanylate cyclase [Roseibium sp.]
MTSVESNTHTEPPDLPSNGSANFQALVEHSSDVVIQVTDTGDLLYVSPSINALFGWSRADMFAEMRLMIEDDDRDLITALIQGLKDGDPPGEALTFQILKQDGHPIWVTSVVYPLPPGDDGRGSYAIYLRDCSERRQMQQRFEELAQSDALTGLANHQTFNEAVRREWARAKREKTYLTMVIIDLDHFDGLNNDYGDEFGDQCLISIAGILKTTARRPADIAARIGGQRFALLLPRTHEEGARTISETIRTAIHDLQIKNSANADHDSLLTASLGVATALCLDNTSATPMDRLVGAAEKALKKAKLGGRNRTRFTKLMIQQAA